MSVDPSDAPGRCPQCGEHAVRHEFDLGCDICSACGHVLTERALTTTVQYNEDGALGTFLHDGATHGGHLAAARGGLTVAAGVNPSVARKMFRDEQTTHLENISKAVNFAAGQLRLSKDAAADAKALVVRASEGRWGDGDWTTLLVGACVYAASRQNALPLTIRDVAEACQLDVFAVGRVYNRLKQIHGLRVPPLDPGAFVARAAAAVPALKTLAAAGGIGGVGGVPTGGLAASPSARRASFASAVDLATTTGLVGGALASPTAGTTPAIPSATGAPNATKTYPNQGSNPNPRGANLAPLVEDAKRLLEFAHARGLVTGRNPTSLVAAAVAVAAAARGVKLTDAETAAAARASVESARKAHAALRRELLEFSRAHEWGRAATLKTLPAFLPIALTRVAAALAERAAETTGTSGRSGGRDGEETREETRDGNDGRDGGDGGDGRDGAAVGTNAAPPARRPAASLDAMPVSFRAHEAARISRAARVETAKADIANALVNGGGSAREPSGRDAGRADTNGRASESAATTAKQPARSKPPSRGGVKRARSRGGRTWDTPAPDEPDDDETETKANAAAAFKTASGAGSRDGPPASLRVSRELGWSDVVLQRLLLEGVPDRFLLEEGGLYLNATRGSGSARRAASRGEEAAARAAADRVRARVRAEAEGRADPNGGVDRLADDATASRMDMEAIAAIPDEEIAPLLRTPAEAAMARAMAGSALGGGAAFFDAGGSGAPPRKEGEEKGKGEKEGAVDGEDEDDERDETGSEGSEMGAGSEGWTAGGIKAEETNPNPGPSSQPRTDTRARRSTRRVRA